MTVVTGPHKSLPERPFASAGAKPTYCNANMATYIQQGFVQTGWICRGQEIKVNYLEFQWNPSKPIYPCSFELNVVWRGAQQKLRSVERTKSGFPLSCFHQREDFFGRNNTVSELLTATMLSKFFSLRSHFIYVILAPQMALGENHVTNTNIPGTDAILQKTSCSQVEE